MLWRWRLRRGARAGSGGRSGPRGGWRRPGWWRPGWRQWRQDMLAAAFVPLLVGAWFVKMMLPPAAGAVVRDQPLSQALQVFRISLDPPVLEVRGGIGLRLGAIEVVPWCREAAWWLLRAAIAQGVVVDRVLDDGSALLVCEPRVFHGCGNDPVAVHHERTSLQALLVSSGSFRLTHTAGLTGAERRRLRSSAKTSGKVRETRRDLGARRHRGAGIGILAYNYVRDALPRGALGGSDR